MTTKISPAFMIELVSKVEKAIWDKYSSYKNVMRYINRWHESGWDSYGNNFNENFEIKIKDDKNVDLPATLDGMSDELLFQLAVDLGIQIPGLIYAVAEIKGMLATKYEDIGSTFNKAFEKVHSDPATSIIMANSALERLIKKICADSSIDSCNTKDTLYKLTAHVLKQFNYFPDKALDENVRNIGSGLLKTSQAIENIRSNHTEAHGTESEIIKNPLYAMLIVNSISTVGLFLLNYYDKEYTPEPSLDDEIPF